MALGVAAVTVVPLAAARAQDAGLDPNVTIEGSGPLGGDVNCTTAATLDPDHGPPGTVVTVTATFMGNCDDFAAGDFTHECTGSFSGESFEGVSFEMEDAPKGSGFDFVGTFTAPAVEPDPPVVDAIEPLTVTVTCTFPGFSCSAEGGCAPAEGSTTTYHYPPATFNLELFADTDTDQPTIVDNPDEDDDGVDTPGVTPGVVEATPPFTG